MRFEDLFLANFEAKKIEFSSPFLECWNCQRRQLTLSIRFDVVADDDDGDDDDDDDDE